VSGDGAEVGLVVVTYNSADVLPGLLGSVEAGCAGVRTRLVVVDNASTDTSRETVRRLAPEAELVALPANGGYAAGLNAGHAAAGDVGAVLVLNPDVRLRPGVVGRLLTALAAPGVGIAVPRLVDPGGAVAPTLRREPTLLRALGEALLGGNRAGRHPALGEMVTDPAVYDRPASPDWATGAAMLVDRRCWDAVGEWDETFFLYSEETDFALRARDRGFALRYVPEAVAEHIGGEATTDPRLHALLTRNRVALYSKRNGPLRAAPYRVAVAAGEAIRTPRGPLHRQALRALLPGGASVAAGRGTVPTGAVPAGADPGPVPLSVVVPAHNEERSIEANLRLLLAGAEPGEFDVVVVCNGCTDGTAAAAGKVPGVRVEERTEPGKNEAMRHGDAVARGFPRLYLDADVGLDTGSARRLGRAVAEPGVLAAGPRRRLLLDRSGWVVRAYYDVWQRLPAVSEGLFGRGVIAVSAAGHARVRALPPARSDDLAVHLAFGPTERQVVPDATVAIRPPRTVADLFRRRIRALQGTTELRGTAAAGSQGSTSWADLAAVARAHPSSMAGLPVFLGFAVAAKLAVRSGRFDGATWLRDESSRETD
jgi:GT2 family glycosyltransferase